MCGLEWGRLYKAFRNNAYNPAELNTAVQELFGDAFVKNRKGIYEYLLGGATDARLLDVRVFEESTKRAAYKTQTDAATEAGTSNCPLCAVGDNANKDRLWKLTEMDADHVAAWGQGGATVSSNCEMLCRTHNQAKGSR